MSRFVRRLAWTLFVWLSAMGVGQELPHEGGLVLFVRLLPLALGLLVLAELDEA